MVAPSQDLVPNESQSVFNAVGEALHEHFYDENLNGLDWGAVERRYLGQFEQARTAERLRDLIREVLNLVNASPHFGFSPRRAGPDIQHPSLRL